ncbi:hypothetical protein NYF14_11580 [Sphingobium sp. 10 DY56-G10]
MRQMQAGPTILFPGADGILSQGLALDILRDGFPHDPVRTASTDFRQLPGTPFQGIIEFDGCHRCHGLAFWEGNTLR